MEKTALLLIDVQKGFDDPVWGKRNNVQAESRIVTLLNLWRKEGLPVVHVKHCSTSPGSPLHPDRPGNAFKDQVVPLEGEVEFSKEVNSAFIGTGLQDYLQDQGLGKVVIVGLTTDHCVSTSTRMASNLGFEVVLVSDATATFGREDMQGEYISAEDMHRINLASLNGEFCQVMTTDEIVGQVNDQ